MDELREKIFGDPVYINLDLFPKRELGKREIVQTRNEELAEYMDELEQDLFWDYYNRTTKKGSMSPFVSSIEYLGFGQSSHV